MVVTIDINDSTLNETSSLTGNDKNRLTTFVTDITNKLSVESLRDNILTQPGIVDGIINNAGLIQPFEKVYFRVQ